MTGRRGIIDRARQLANKGANGHAEVVDFLSCVDNFPHAPGDVEIIETHLSLIFLAGDLVYKLKRPIELDYLDCRSLDARRQACERELSINQRLAPGIYLETVAVTRDAKGQLALGGRGEPVEWLLVMRRLETTEAFDWLVSKGQARAADLERVCDTLAEFYANQVPLSIPEEEWVDLWREKIGLVRKSLTEPDFNLPAETVASSLGALEHFVRDNREILLSPLRARRVVDGHGDLKPEHIYLGDKVLIIDRLEFDERLRWCDPFDEIVFLGMECSRLGAPWIAPMLIEKLTPRLGQSPPKQLLRFYRCYRACMRARLMIEHLRDKAPRTPELWPKKAQVYLDLAADALPLNDQTYG